MTEVGLKEYSIVLYRAYTELCRRIGVEALSTKWFGAQMTAIFGTSHSLRINKASCGKAYYGVALKT